jgi:spermidine synthase
MHLAIPFLLVFFLSGATGLVYEVLWTRQLAMIFGVTTYAFSTVLATYMGGLALGSYLMGRRVDRVRNPLLLYAALEAAIGLYELVVPELFKALRPLYVGLAHLELSYPVF